MKNHPMCNAIPRLSSESRFFVVAVLSLLALSVAPCAFGQSAKDADARTRATALFAKALAASDLRAPGSPPFEVRGTITVKQRFGKPIVGSYSLEWASPEKWREEIHIADYTRIRVGGKNQYWQSHTTPYEVLSVLELSRALDFLKELHVWSNAAAVADLKSIKFHDQKMHGAKLHCVTLTPEGPNPRSDFCFDPATETLATINILGQIEFSNFISFEGKHFPGNIREEVKAADPLTFDVNSISPLSSVADADFQPPEGSTVWPSCDAPDALPIIKSQVPPSYPDKDKLAHKDGTVFTYLVIGADGQTTDLKVLSAPDQLLANSALTSIATWKYAPETCSGMPVPVETFIAINYQLGY